MLDILLVDDDELVRQSLTLLLTHEGFHVYPAEGGRQALELARERPFDLVVCDIRMPDLDGIQTVGQLRDLLPEAHLIMITGYASEDAPVEALRLRVDDYLRKPFDLNHFLERVRQLRRERRHKKLASPETVLQSLTDQLRRKASWSKHIDDVEHLVLSAGERLGLGINDLRALKLAARLHDLVRTLPAEETEQEEDPHNVLEHVGQLLLSYGASRALAAQVLTAAVELSHGGDLSGLNLDASVIDEVRRGLSDQPAPEVEKPTPLRVCTLGSTRVIVEGQEIAPASWESARARWLFIYLVSRRGQWVSQERLRDLFWPGHDGDKAQRALVSSVHRCRKALGNADLVVRSERGYGLNPDLVCWWDVDQMERSAREGRAREAQPQEAIRAYRTAESLYKGEFAPECSEEWALPVRDQALHCAVECLERLSALLLEGDSAAAEGRARRALELEPTSEAACAVLVRSLGAQSRRDEATRLYHQFSRTLERELGLPPGPELARAYLELSML